MTIEIDYLERVESDDPGGGEVAVYWKKMTGDHASDWQKKIQPTIANDARRADRNWRWSQIYVGLQVFSSIRQHKPEFLTALVRLPNGIEIPVGMLMMLTEYPRIDGEIGGTVFTWFLTSAPKSILRTLGVEKCPNLGRALVDCGIVKSYRVGKGGHTWLHCALRGKEFLFNFYKEKCKLHRFPMDKSLPVKNPLVRGNDGRHFFTDMPLAKTLTNELDGFRPQPVKAR